MKKASILVQYSQLTPKTRPMTITRSEDILELVHEKPPLATIVFDGGFSTQLYNKSTPEKVKKNKITSKNLIAVIYRNWKRNRKKAQ